MAQKNKSNLSKRGRMILPCNAPARKLELSVSKPAPIAYIRNNKVWALVRQGVYVPTDLTLIADYYKDNPRNA